jgi:hypothetical protein
METIRHEHLTEAEIEDCVRSRLPRQYAPGVMDHLMNCDECSALLEQEIEIRRNFLKALELAPQAEARTTKTSWPVMRWLTAPALAAAALAAFLFVGPTLRQPGGGTQTVELAAYRGTVNTAVAAGSPVVLKMDASGLETEGAVELRVVDTEGREVWRSTPHRSGNQWVDEVKRDLARGVYWVRLNRAGQQDVIREFRLEVK